MATVDPPDLLSAGNRALERGAWQEGRELFLRAADVEPTPEAIESVAMAAWWLDDDPIVFASRERAYRLYRERDDLRGAGRMATALALDHYMYRGDVAIANGWLQRAHRYLDDLEPCAEQGWLAIWEAHVALFERHDVAMARRAGEDTRAFARANGLTDLEMLALALEGLALVSGGEVEQGMRRLDEATTAALAGEVSDPDAVVTICCYLIYACERVRDLTRAAQWCASVEAIARRWGYRSMFGFCRNHYAVTLMWQGDWTRAEAELTAAMHELMMTRPGWTREPLVHLAELRRRQGRRDEALALFEQARDVPYALLGLAEVALDDGDAVTATELADRYLRRVPSDDLTTRAEGLEVAVRAWVERGDIGEASLALAQLDATVDAIGAEPLRAGSQFCRGLVLDAKGDLPEARRCQEDAVDLLTKHGAPFESARARVALARILLTLGRRDPAVSEGRSALDVFQRVGAWREVWRADSLWRQLGLQPDSRCAPAIVAADLTPREAEVLRLVAAGATNHEIADRLFISVRTVERHISSIYAKIGAAGTAARAIATVYAFEHGLARALGTHQPPANPDLRVLSP